MTGSYYYCEGDVGEWNSEKRDLALMRLSQNLNVTYLHREPACQLAEAAAYEPRVLCLRWMYDKIITAKSQIHVNKSPSHEPCIREVSCSRDPILDFGAKFLDIEAKFCCFWILPSNIYRSNTRCLWNRDDEFSIWCFFLI